MPTKKEATKPPNVVDESQMGIQQYLDHIKEKYTAQADIEDQAKKSAKEIHDKIGQSPEQMWFPFAPMPTELCRTSPFFPMAKQNMTERPYIRDMVITDNSWGKITYTGPKLSTYEEDVLMAILALLDEAKNREEIEVEGKTTYTYTGPIRPILRLMGYKTFGSSSYNRAIESMKLLHGAVVDFRKKGVRRKINNILIDCDIDEKSKQLTVTVNPYFHEMYMAGSITLLDVIRRARLKSPIAKSLDRFIQSHRDKSWRGHIITLAVALNLDLEQPMKQTRRQIKDSINILINNGILEPSSTVKNDIVTLAKIVPKTGRGDSYATPTKKLT